MTETFRDPWSNWRPWLLTLGLVALLIVLGTLQYQWLGKVADANRLQTQAAIDTAAERFADDFNQELDRLFLATRGGRLGREPSRRTELLTEAAQSWRETSAFPELLKELWILNDEGLRSVFGDGDSESFELRADEPEPERPVGPDVEPELQELYDRLSPLIGKMLIVPGGESIPFSMLEEKVPALVLPVIAGGRPPIGPLGESGRSRDRRSAESNPSGEEPTTRGRRRGRRDPHPRPEAFVIVQLDRRVIVEQVLPSLAERHFGTSLPYFLRLVDPWDTLTGQPETEIFRWGPEPAGSVGTSVDAQAQLFGPLLRNRDRDRSRWGRLFDAMAAWGQIHYGRWTLEVRHPEGSLEIALNKARRRNLLLASGILSVLCAALVILTRNANRSRRLARQQLDFVAGITHEIMTPLAALRSAGQNLADGVVKEPEQVSRYGRMIDREGLRLTDLVGQVLTFARLQSHRPRFNRELLDPAALVHRAVEELRPQLEAENVEPTVEIEPNLPPVYADAQAVTRALGNLISNAVKYGQRAPREGSGWIGTSCRREGREICFAVEDRGEGIAAAEQASIFEPFSRGSGKAAGNIPGTGLGLALVKDLVEHHGGKIRLKSKIGQGSTFTLCLPIAAEEIQE